MSRRENVILTNMCMVSDGNGNVLMQNRLAKDWPGLIFPGGHVEAGESFVGSVIREVREETGITPIEPKLCGVKQFMTDEGARYVVFLYRANRFTGKLRSSREGEVFWVPREKLFEYPTVPDFAELVRVFEEPDLNEFLYRRGSDDWKISLL